MPVSGADGMTVVRTAVPAADLHQGVTRAWGVLAMVGVVLLGGTALAGDRIAARLSRSVRDLAGVAERLGSGDLSARVDTVRTAGGRVGRRGAQRPGRPGRGPAGRRARAGRRPLAPAAHPDHGVAAGRRLAERPRRARRGWPVTSTTWSVPSTRSSAPPASTTGAHRPGATRRRWCGTGPGSGASSPPPRTGTSRSRCPPAGAGAGRRARSRGRARRPGGQRVPAHPGRNRMPPRGHRGTARGGRVGHRRGAGPGRREPDRARPIRRRLDRTRASTSPSAPPSGPAAGSRSARARAARGARVALALQRAPEAQA